MKNQSPENLFLDRASGFVCSLIFLLTIGGLAGCATQSNGGETNATAGNLAQIRGDAKAAIGISGSIARDAKEIRRILNR